MRKFEACVWPDALTESNIYPDNSGMRYFFAAMTLFAMGCAFAPLPKEEREITYTEATTVNRSDAYRAVRAYLAKELVDGKNAMKVQDEQTSTIITRLGIDCPELSTFPGNEHTLILNLEFNAKDNRARMIFELIADEASSALGGPVSTGQFLAKHRVDAARPCVQRERDIILKTIHSKSNSPEW